MLLQSIGPCSRLVLSAGLVACALSFVSRHLRRFRSHVPLPPGPQGWPVVGNVFQIPGKYVWRYIRELHLEYGPLVTVKLPGQVVIAIGDREIAKEIFGRRSEKYSDRPKSLYFERYIDLSGRWWAFREASPHWRRARTLTQRVMTDVSAGSSEEVQTMESRLFLRDLLEDPNDYRGHCKRFSASVVETMAYGIHSRDRSSKYVHDVAEAAEELLAEYNPPAFAINIMPKLDALPDWCARWRRRAVRKRQWMDDFWKTLEEKAFEEPDVNHWLRTFNSAGDDGKNMLCNILLAGAETSHVALEVFFLACVSHPRFVRTAQAHIDRVTGGERLPTFADRADLPYIDAIVREILRWRPAAPIGVPHRCTEDDVFTWKGKTYFIPKGAMVLACQWTIDNDPDRVGLDPLSFIPERHLARDGMLLEDFTNPFGFGKRVCVGAPFALRSLWICVASILASFDVQKGKDVNGMEVEIDDLANDGQIVPHPLPFACSITPRNPDMADMISREWDGCEKNLAYLLPCRS